MRAVWLPSQLKMDRPFTISLGVKRADMSNTMAYFAVSAMSCVKAGPVTLTGKKDRSPPLWSTDPNTEVRTAKGVRVRELR